LSEAHKGRFYSAGTKVKMSEVHQGKICSAETKARLSTAKGTAIYIYIRPPTVHL